MHQPAEQESLQGRLCWHTHGHVLLIPDLVPEGLIKEECWNRRLLMISSCSVWPESAFVPNFPLLVLRFSFALTSCCDQTWFWPWLTCLPIADLSLVRDHDPAKYPLLTLACFLTTFLQNTHCWPWHASRPWSCQLTHCWPFAFCPHLCFPANRIPASWVISHLPPQSLPPAFCGFSGVPVSGCFSLLLWGSFTCFSCDLLSNHLSEVSNCGPDSWH